MNCRPSQRSNNECREISFTRNFTCHAEGSVLVSCGNTKVLCTASIEAQVPRFLQDSQQGWLTAEYGMLPRSTHTRMQREAARGKQSGRTQEIQRLIGRSLRAALDLKKMPGITIKIDCDVIQADGGTRTAAINGACVALVDALHTAQRQKIIQDDPLKYLINAVSVGIYKGQAILDLDYQEDSNADTDMNIVMTAEGEFIEIQGTAEAAPFSDNDMQAMLKLAKHGCQIITKHQHEALELVK